MNNIVILLTALVLLFISFAECHNSENMALFFFACLICIPAVVVSIVGIIFGKNFFEC